MEKITPLCNTEQQTTHDTIGYHVIAELNQCNKALLSDIEFIKEIMHEGVRRSNATIINSHFHKFSPTGVSGVILLSESHASIHTWPEQGYASIDIYTCGNHVNPELTYQYISEQLKSSSNKLTVIQRGIHTEQSIHSHHTIK